MTFRCMPAFQTLGGGDCGASWVSASRLRKDCCRNRRHSRAWWPLPCGFMKCLVLRGEYIPLVSTLFDVFVAVSPPPVSAWRATPNADKPHAIQRIDDICASVRFYSINSLSSFSKRCYRLGVSGLRNFIEIFSEIGAAIYFYTSDEFLLSENSLLTHRNFFNHGRKCKLFNYQVGAVEAPFVFLMTHGRINDDTLQFEKTLHARMFRFLEKSPPFIAVNS